MLKDGNKILGNRLKKVRQEQGWTQAKLAEDICTQAQVSNIEKGSSNDNPSSHTLFLLSEKLNVSMSYLYGQDKYSYNQGNNELSEVKALIENSKRRRDYLTLKYIINNEISKTTNLSYITSQYLLWHKAIYTYYLENDYQTARNLFDDALIPETSETTIDSKLQNINIKLSHGIILNDEKSYEEAGKIIEECLSKYILLNEAYTFGELDIHLFNKIIFNLSLNYTSREKDQESLDYCLNAIQQSKEQNYMGLLGDLVFQAGFNHYNLGAKELGLSYIKESLSIFRIQNNTEMINLVNQYSQKLSK